MSAPPCSGDAAIVAPAARPPRRRGPGRRLHPHGGRAARAATIVVVLALLVAACGVGRSDGEAPAADDDAAPEAWAPPGGTFPQVTLELLDERLDDRVAAQSLTGAALLIDQVGAEPHLHVVGDLGPDTPVPLAESSMLLTAMVVLTLVDDGTLALDDPIAPFLPGLAGPTGSITVRQLLSHTSGLPSPVPCPTPDVTACDAAVASTALRASPGEAFHVTDLDAHVAARVAETASGRPWAELFAGRLAGPVGMQATAYADPSTTGGLLAVDGTTTATDLGRALAVVRDGGTAAGTRVLSEAMVREMLLDQTVRLDTHTEPWVAETGVPTYGLGVWRDRLRGDDAAALVSAPGRYGLHPFVDVARSAWGVVVVDDRTSPRAEVVSASAQLTQLAAAALRRTPG